MQRYDKFLRAFSNDISKIIFRRPYYTGKYDKNGKEIIVYYSIPYRSIAQWNKTLDIYFIPNLGGTKGSQIYEITTIFIDLDAGRKPDGSYKDIEEVQAYKDQKLKEIEAFALKPSVINPTRNGWQVFWLLKSSPDKAAWKIVENKMIYLFQADNKVKKLAQLMRLPYTTWRKPHEGCEPFETTIYRMEDHRYELEEFEDLLRDVIIEKHPEDKGENLQWEVQVDQSEMVRGIIDGDILYLQGVLKPLGTTFESYGDFHRHITLEIDLGALLGISPGIHGCLFHDDATPSASLFKSERQEWVIHCHSSNCGFFGNIRGVIEELRKCSKYQAIRFLMEVFALEITGTDWQLQQRLELEECRRFLHGDLQEFHPDLFD